MDVQDVDVRRPELLQRCLDGDVEGLRTIPRVCGLLLNVVASPLEVRGKLVGEQGISHDQRYNHMVSLTLVAMTIWSRTPRVSIHSPMNSSELSSW